MVIAVFRNLYMAVMKNSFGGVLMKSYGEYREYNGLARLFRTERIW